LPHASAAGGAAGAPAAPDRLLIAAFWTPQARGGAAAARVDIDTRVLSVMDQIQIPTGQRRGITELLPFNFDLIAAREMPAAGGGDEDDCGGIGILVQQSDVASILFNRLRLVDLAR